MRPLFSTIKQILLTAKRTIGRFSRSAGGFSLIEIAIVLAIMATIINFGLPLWSQYRTMKSIQRTETNIQLINQVLGQYFVIYKRLPCPVLISDPEADTHGIAPANCLNNAQARGTVPYRTLGIPYQQTVDGHNQPIQYTVDYEFTERNAFEKILNNADKHQDKIVVNLSHNRNAVIGVKNPVIYVLVAINDANPPVSIAEKANVDNSTVFHSLPYAIDTAAPFRHTVSWMTLRNLIATYGGGQLKLPLPSRDSSPTTQTHDATENNWLSQPNQESQQSLQEFTTSPTINNAPLSRTTEFNQPPLFDDRDTLGDTSMEFDNYNDAPLSD